MRHEVVCLRFRRGGVLAARHVSPVLVLVVKIIAARSVGHHRGVVVRVVIANVVEVHAGIARGGHFHFAVLIARIENQVAAVFPKQHAAAHRGRANAENGVVRAAVLSHDEFHLTARIAQRQVAEVGPQRKLLVRGVAVDFGVGVAGHRQTGAALVDCKVDHECRFFLALIVLRLHRDAVVAGEFRPHVRVGNGQRVVCVEHGGIEAVLVVLNYVLAGGRCEIFRVEQFFVQRAVGVALLHRVSVSPIFVRQVVESERHAVAAAQRDDGQPLKVAVHAQLHRADMPRLLRATARQHRLRLSRPANGEAEQEGIYI